LGPQRIEGASLLIEQVNRAQHSFRVSVDKESDAAENVVERRIGENHFECIEHPLAGQSCVDAGDGADT